MQANNLMSSRVVEMNSIDLPLIKGEYCMLPFDLFNLSGLNKTFKEIVKSMLSGITHDGGTAYFTIHGKVLKLGETLRRGGAHIDGNYEPHLMDFGGGWKVGQEGREVGHPTHDRQFNSLTGGIILTSNYEACNGWRGDYDGHAEKGGDCTHLKLDTPFRLKKNRVYYGNNHFIHESLAMRDSVHRVFARITMPEDHKFYGE